MADLMRLDGLSAKIESSSGTYGAPSLTDDGVRVAERIWSNISFAYQYGHLRDGVASASAIPAAPAIPSAPVVTLDIWAELRGKGSAYADSDTGRTELDALYRACGYGETTVVTGGLETVTHAPTDASHATTSIKAYAGGLSFPIRNCRGNFVIPMTAGELGLIHFTMQGILNADPTAEALAAHTYDSTVPISSTTLALSIGGWSSANMDPESAEFDAGNAVTLVPSGNATSGIEEWGVPSKFPLFTVRARSKVGSYEPFSVLAAGTLGALSMQYGSVQYNKVKISSANLQIMPDGISMIDLDDFTGFEIKYFVPAPSILYD